MRKILAGLLLSLSLLQPQLAAANDKYFYDAAQCNKLGLIPGKRLIEVEEMFQSILEYSGLRGTYYLCPTQYFSEAFAFDPASMENRVSVRGQYIGYDSTFMQNMRNRKVGYWAVYGILAHELAHHKLGHTATGRGSQPGTELRADRMAGEMMQMSGASLADTIRAQRLHKNIAAYMPALASNKQYGIINTVAVTLLMHQTIVAGLRILLVSTIGAWSLVHTQLIRKTDLGKNN